MKPGAVILFIIFWILLVSFLAWRNPVKPDLSSDFEETEGQFYEDSGVGHPLWNN